MTEKERERLLRRDFAKTMIVCCLIAFVLCQGASMYVALAERGYINVASWQGLSWLAGFIGLRVAYRLERWGGD